MRNRRSKCLSCRQLFKVDARNRGRQRYCSKPHCRRVSKARSQQHWLQQPVNQNYFRDADNAARVRAWQEAHPGYWRQTTRYKGRTLQDPCRTQAVEPAKDSATLTLQETLQLQAPVLLGLIATLTDSTLQEDIVASSRRLLQLGQDILSGKASDARQTGAAP